MKTTSLILMACASLLALPTLVDAITCIACPRKPMCRSDRENPAREMSRRLCGVYDNATPQSCTRTYEIHSICPGGVEDPATYGYGYGYASDAPKLGFTCISGSDCY